MQLGEYRYVVLVVAMISLVMFYCAHWSTYCTGQLRFSRFDVTEAQMMVIGVLILTAVCGPSIWSIHVFKINFKPVMLTCCFVMAFWQVAGYLKVIFSEGTGKNGSTVADTSVLFPLFPLLAVCLPFWMIYSKSTSGIYDEHITLFCVCFGAVMAKATNRLVIAHMSRSELEMWDWIYVGPLLMILNQYYDFYYDEYRLLIVATIYAWISLLIYCVSVCKQFCQYLNIFCFKLKPPEKSRLVAASNGSSRRDAKHK
jgi:hypothetical protein